MGDIFFTSDTHFGHRGIIKHTSRPFDSVEEMDAALISNWNSKIGTQDTVYHLGDFSFSSTARTADVFGSLNGRKHLVLGNHDYAQPRWIKDLFDSSELFRTFKIDGRRVDLCHFPMHSWNRGAWMLHGHTHGSLPMLRTEFGIRMDVGMDNHELQPISFDQIREMFQ